MAIEQVTVTMWETDDGNRFATEAEAEKHEVFESIKHLLSTHCTSNVDATEAATVLANRVEELKEILR